MISQEARVELPPPNGVKLKTEAIGLCVVEETAAIGKPEPTDGR